MIHNDDYQNIRYWKADNGYLVCSKSGERARAISGSLTRIMVREDAGNPEYNVAPGLVLNVSLSDGDEVEVITGRLNTHWGQSLARAVMNIERGDHIKIGMSQSDQNAKVHFAWCVKLADDGSHIKIERPPLPSAEEREAWCESAMREHSAYDERPREDGDERHSDDDPFEEE